ncbi:MAG: methylated-DNA--[protein]-cysteine S-methyltransferase [Burkholderiales bacterium]|nr:methylated-DNA--[protein]-cysteine S-methyltransferase [Burkholderiales bacterium]MDE1927617.1 methylated-DNA--[protein]-cysteine S-methyltransferase [Burkholderiales bacterium]MDE2501867.1 methylated-DNA--[protein]-cysteine S-methyltransferase [Burkholderiales bacterium]
MKTIPYAAQTRVETPLGPLTLAATARGLALAWFDGQAHRSAEVDAPQRPDDPHLRLAAREFEAYWLDPARPFTVALDARGTAFQQAVWNALRALCAGRLATYGEIARRIGRPTAVRAVGAAIGRNPISIIVPCHRVVGGDGSLTGYAGGLDRKRSLLEREGALAPARRGGRTAAPT